MPQSYTQQPPGCLSPPPNELGVCHYGRHELIILLHRLFPGSSPAFAAYYTVVHTIVYGSMLLPGVLSHSRSCGGAWVATEAAEKPENDSTFPVCGSEGVPSLGLVRSGLCDTAYFAFVFTLLTL